MMMGLSRLVGAGGTGVSSSSMMMGLSRLVGGGASTSIGTALAGASVTLTGGATAITVVEASSRGVARGFFGAGVVEGASGCFRLPAPRAAATAASTCALRGRGFCSTLSKRLYARADDAYGQTTTTDASPDE